MRLACHYTAHPRHVANNISGALPQRLQLSRELTFALPSDWTAGQLRFEAIHHLAQPPFNLVDVIFEENEGPLDFLESEALRHHHLDRIDPANCFHRIETLAATVLPFAADSATPRQQTRLDVFAESRFGESDALGLEDLQDGSRRHARREVPFDLFDFLWSQDLH